MIPAEEDQAFLEQLRSLLAQGQKIEAIRRYRERTGLGLKEAKDRIEALERGDLPAPAADDDLEQKLLALLQQGKKIEAIKVYRQARGVGLRDAKEAIEAWAASRGLPSGKAGCLSVFLLAIIFLVGWWAAVADVVLRWVP